MTDSQHPWLTGSTAPEPGPAPVRLRQRELPRPVAPQPGVPTPETADRLPARRVNGPASLWWLGVHGGAGETTLAQLVAGTRPAGHAWPVRDTGLQANVMLVARSNAAGLTAAQRAATEWACGTLPFIRLLGLVIIADAPGKLPKPLRELSHLVSGGVPHSWHLPWMEAWRLGDPVTLENATKDVRDFAATVNTLVETSA